MRARPAAGPDPAFPRLEADQRIAFPATETAVDGVVAYGGNLSPGMLLSAYEQGVFPWYSVGEPLLWHSPDPRFVLKPEWLHVPESLRRVLKKGIYTVEYDRAFPAVIRACAEAYRPGQRGTWIVPEMIDAYVELHELGWAHSVEAYRDGELAGGLYGLRLGEAFFGESMFARADDASKAAFATAAAALFADGVAFIDCQVATAHLARFGAREIPRRDYLGHLAAALAAAGARPGAADRADRRGSWRDRYRAGYGVNL